jgi:Alw26I/Eco31I/Esp3I family type II restriction endonuclease
VAKKAEYGRGHPTFLEYVEFIVNHPSYAGMPDLYGDDGVQWIAAPNRKSGKFQHSHLRRMEWWRKTAEKLGIEQTGEWPSEVAKKIHPTKEKPCIKCGKVMDIRYAYPAHHVITRIQKLEYVDDSFPLDRFEHISDLLTRMVERFGNRVFDDLPALLKANGVEFPRLPPALDAWLSWIDTVYIPSEPRGVLSPGVMSNCPDRLDGFHSFNRCCRETADPGRSKENLQSYTTDRRVFEYWVDGDWVAADHLMGKIRSDRGLKREACRGGHPGPCSADHIGPISLGFAHRAEFQFLCTACNSGKNNRMWLSDVTHLVAAEGRGEQVTSWYCKEVWDLCKGLVTSEEMAKRLSKVLRDNRHTVMHMLGEVARAGHHTFLSTFLGLEYAAQEPTFEGLHAENHITVFDRISVKPRETKYAVEQMARRLRVAFSALREYVSKENRNALIITSDEIKARVASALKALEGTTPDVKRLDEQIRQAVTAEVPAEETLRALVVRIPARAGWPANLQAARADLTDAMGLVARQLHGMWNHDRFLREIAEEEGPALEGDEGDPTAARRPPPTSPSLPTPR